MQASSGPRTILAIAVPAMLANLATAFFGLADLFVIGRLGEPAAQGGVEIGAKLLMTLLIVFNFLRASTTALTAQAAGAGDLAGAREALVRALACALLLALLLFAAAPAAIPLGLRLFSATGAVARQADLYVRIRYVGALPWLLNAVLTGWLIGQRRVRTVLLVEILANLVHVCLDLALVLGAGQGVAGVAVATLVSEGVKLAALAGAAAARPSARGFLRTARAQATYRGAELARLFRLNRDLFARTVLLMAAVVLLTRAGALQGEVVLAANAILYQFFIFSALLLDGFENAAQVLCGERAAEGGRAGFAALVRAVLALAGAAALVIAGAYALLAGDLAGRFSAAPRVVLTARAHIGWAVLMPLAGFASYVFDGVFIGAGWTGSMLASMAIALAGFGLALLALKGSGDDGLWCAFAIFLLARGGAQALMTPGLIRGGIPAAAGS
jgi:MATE family multidrug resistance protein